MQYVLGQIVDERSLIDDVVLLMMICQCNVVLIHIVDLTLGRPGGGGWVPPPPWRFSPITFLVIPTGKIASVYLILGIEDTFWHM